ncbi:MAG: ADP-ribosylation factor-like protein [Promethearchaeota archaeon]
MDVKKIVLMGLDNCGKTSIVHSLQGNSNLLSLCTMTPTQNKVTVNFDARGKSFSIWDFGGQEVFRNEHIKNMESNLRGTDKLIYVIDIQEKEKYGIAIDYLGKILASIRGKNIPVSIFLHKFDPQIELDEDYSKDALENELLSGIRKVIPEGMVVKVFRTTIFTVFQKTPIIL